ERRLSATRFADQSQGLTASNGEIDAAQGPQRFLFIERTADGIPARHAPHGQRTIRHDASASRFQASESRSSAGMTQRIACPLPASCRPTAPVAQLAIA